MGEPDADGVYRKYRIPKDKKPKHKPEPAGKSISWSDLVDSWFLVVRDLAEFCGVRLYEESPDLSWIQLREDILGLLSNPKSRTYRALLG